MPSRRERPVYASASSPAAFGRAPHHDGDGAIRQPRARPRCRDGRSAGMRGRSRAPRPTTTRATRGPRRGAGVSRAGSPPHRVPARAGGLRRRRRSRRATSSATSSVRRSAAPYPTSISARSRTPLIVAGRQRLSRASDSASSGRVGRRRARWRHSMLASAFLTSGSSRGESRPRARCVVDDRGEAAGHRRRREVLGPVAQEPGDVVGRGRAARASVLGTPGRRSRAGRRRTPVGCWSAWGRCPGAAHFR